MSKSAIVEAALELARQGFAVFPVHAIRNGKCTCGDSKCESPGKHPRTANGFKDASNDPVVVEQMFAKFSDANIAIATGPASACWVLDVEAAGLLSLGHLERKHGKLPETVSANTGGGGCHYFFKYNGREIKNKQKLGGLPIDVRGVGGYVVAPPSRHITGRLYDWVNEPGSMPFAEAPDYLIDMVTDQAPKPNPMVVEVKQPVDDLATAPGAAKGNRHGMALKLIGSAIGRGVDQLEVLRQATDWGLRCNPPMEDEEVIKIVSDLSKRQASQPPPVTNAEIELEPLPEQIPWPTLSPDALHGLAGEIVNVIEPETEADKAAVLAQLLVSFGNLIGRSPYYVVEATRHHSNLFAVLVGRTSRGRKGTSEGRSRQILSFVDGEWTTNNTKTGLVSGEGVIYNVRDAAYKLEQIKEKGKVVGTEEVLADPGVTDKRLLVIEPEFAAVLRVCRRETNTLSPTLRSAWDSGHLRTLAKNSPTKATNAHISIVGHITVEELRRSLSEADSLNGFANRFLWVAVKRSKLLPDGGRDLDLTGPARRLAETATVGRQVERMHRSEAAAKLWRQVYPELAGDGASGMFGAVTSRAEAQVLRLSMVYALISGSSAIEEPHLRAALALWSYCQASARLIFGNTSCDPLAERLLEIMSRCPGVSRRDLHRALGNRVKGPVLLNSLVTLRDSGRARVETIQTGGRPTEAWFCTDPDLCSSSSFSSFAIQADGEPGSEESDLSSSDSLSSQPQDGEVEEDF
jgi:hypothetical protein